MEIKLYAYVILYILTISATIALVGLMYFLFPRIVYYVHVEDVSCQLFLLNISHLSFRSVRFYNKCSLNSVKFSFSRGSMKFLFKNKDEI